MESPEPLQVDLSAMRLALYAADDPHLMDLVSDALDRLEWVEDEIRSYSDAVCGISDFHTPFPAGSAHCGGCGQLWPCETRELASTPLRATALKRTPGPSAGA